MKNPIRYTALFFAGFLMALPSNGQESLFSNWNVGSVSNSPTRVTTFTVSGQWQVQEITTYHWNNGRGARPGWVALSAADGRSWGPYEVTAMPGQGGVQNAVWRIRPSVVLEAGTYTVVDSHPGTWSHNSGSSGAGFVEVIGTRPGEAPGRVISSGGDSALDAFGVFPRQALSGYNNRHLTNVSRGDCAAACLAETAFGCVSFDYYRGSNECDLSDTAASDAGGLFSSDSYDHFALGNGGPTSSPPESRPTGSVALGLGQFVHFPSSALSGYNNRHLTNVSRQQCASACLAESGFQCRSFDYYNSSNACDLSDTRVPAGDLSQTSTYDHYSRKQ